MNPTTDLMPYGPNTEGFREKAAALRVHKSVVHLLDGDRRRDAVRSLSEPDDSLLNHKHLSQFDEARKLTDVAGRLLKAFGINIDRQNGKKANYHRLERIILELVIK